MAWSSNDLIIYRIENDDFSSLQTWLAQRAPHIWDELEKIGLKEDKLPQYLAVIQVGHDPKRETKWYLLSHEKMGLSSDEIQALLSKFWAPVGAGGSSLIADERWPAVDSGNHTVALAELEDDDTRRGIRVITHR